MDSISLISSDARLFHEVEGLLKKSGNPEFRSLALQDPRHALEFLNMEMPELALVDCSDPRFDAIELLRSITVDPWLFHGGIIALCNSYDCSGKIEDVKGANVVATLLREDLAKNLPTVMAVVGDNRRILFQRELGADLVLNISGSFKLANNTVEAGCYSSLIANFLCASNRISLDDKPALTMAIYEMIINAIEHGNCGISYQEKTAWMEQGRNIGELIEQKCNDPAIAAKRVTFEYAFLPDCARFFIADEGNGFDWRDHVDKKMSAEVFELHGRGIFMTKGFTRNLRYNAAGNEVSFDVVYSKDLSAATPGVLTAMEMRDIGPDQIIFNYGEPSDYLYYIVKGQYDVIVNGRTISSLSPDDIFMGEMSFLLNNRRSATVKAKTAGKLIQISKKDFIETIKKKPQYGLFLSRLLAQRIRRLNEKAFVPS